MRLYSCASLSSLAIAAGVGACDSKTIIGADSASGDSADADADSDADSDSDADVDTTGLTFVVDGETTGQAFAIIHFGIVTDQETGETAITGGEILLDAAAGASITVDAPAPDEALLDIVDDSGAAWNAGFFFPALHDDDEAENNQLDDGETFTGAGPNWLLYAGEPLNPQLAGAGIELGWNALKINGENQVPTLWPLDAIPMERNLSLNLDLSLSGTLEGPMPDASVRLAMVPGALSAGHPVAHWLYDEEYLGAEWEIDLHGRPSADHFYDVGGGFLAAVEFPLTYIDADNSADFTDGDSPGYPACDGVATVFAYWVDGPTDFASALTLPGQGIRPGWLALRHIAETDTEPESNAIVLETNYTGLVLGGSCSL